MSSKVTRTRKSDRNQPPEAPVVADVPTAPQVPSATEQSAVKAPATEVAPRLATDDLMALADMDPAELAALMEGAVTQGALEAGTKVEGRVTRVEQQVVLVDVGGKSEAWIDRAEVPQIGVGETLIAYVIATGESEVQLSTQLSGAAASAFLDEAHASGIPVEGRVASSNKGGFEIRFGDARAFCPRSMISRHYVEEPSVYVGQTLSFKVLEVGDKIVVSHRAIEEEHAEKFAAEFWQRVHEGMELDGTVRNVQPFGVFVDVGGVDGLVPKREMSWDMGANPADLVNIGEAVQVRVVQVDQENKKLTLSLKNADSAPWKQVGSDFVEGGVYKGDVVRATTFGLFIRLAEGLDGLMHVSKIKGTRPEVGTSMEVRIISIDHDRQRIALAIPGEDDAVVSSKEAEEVTGRVTEVMRNGVVIELEDGRNAWLPASEVDLPSNTMLAQRFRRGHTVTAKVKDASRPNRITVTQKEQNDEDWRQVARTAKAKAKKQTFGTLGDLFAGLDLKK